MKLQYGNVVNMAVAGHIDKMCHFVFYIMYFWKVIVYNIPEVGEEGLLAYFDQCHLSFHYNRRLILILASFFVL